MTDAAPDAAARIQSLITLTQSLSDLFERENILIANGRPDELGPLQAEKKRLAAAYAQSIRALADARALIDGADALLLEELRSMTASFEARAARQKTLLERASGGGAKAPMAPGPLNPS
jgi:hypothetical protein